MIYRITIANVEPEQVAEYFSGQGFDGTITTGIGVSASWNDGKPEPVVIFETTGNDRTYWLRKVVKGLLEVASEDAAYVTLDGDRAELWYADLSVEVLSP